MIESPLCLSLRVSTTNIYGIFEEAQVWNPIQGAGLDLAWWCSSR